MFLHAAADEGIFVGERFSWESFSVIRMLECRHKWEVVCVCVCVFVCVCVCARARVCV